MNSNPTANIDLSFSHYALAREQAAAAHMVDGATDYSFAMDREMHRKLSLIKPLHALAKASMGFAVAVHRQIMEMQAVAVGPKQYPEIHAMGETCARRLGIGLPQIFVKFDIVPNAYTLATDQSGDVIVLHTSLIEMMTPEELLFIIGHEAGHIHNQHVVYNTMVQLLTNPVCTALLEKVPGSFLPVMILRSTMGMMLTAWSRCAEVTADRAGMICCGDVTAARHALAKLATGGGAKLSQINLEEFVKQIETVQSTPIRLSELGMDHPLTAKRIEALRLFAASEVWYSWHPEARAAGVQGETIEEVDDRCRQFIRVLSSGYQGFQR